jgi:hypothetical protein
LGRSKEDLHPLEENPRWAPIRIQPDLGVWTDDFSSVLRVMRWNMPVSLRGKAY